MTGPGLFLGVELMDTDHQRIERIFGDISVAPDGRLPQLFRELADELGAHFAREEDLMKARNFPGLHCHVAQHTSILDQMRGGEQFLSTADVESLRNHLAVLMPQLVQSHVFSLDRITAAFLKGEFDRSQFEPLRMPVEP